MTEGLACCRIRGERFRSGAEETIDLTWGRAKGGSACFRTPGSSVGGRVLLVRKQTDAADGRMVDVQQDDQQSSKPREEPESDQRELRERDIWRCGGSYQRLLQNQRYCKVTAGHICIN